MVRPCFLVIDKEFFGSISTRKLVIETAKFNVITAYSGTEAIATLERYPAVNGIVLDAGVADIPATELCSALKSLQAEVPIILVGRPGAAQASGADHYVDSFDPAQVLKLLKSLEPKHAAEIAQHEAELNSDS